MENNENITNPDASKKPMGEGAITPTTENSANSAGLGATAARPIEYSLASFVNEAAAREYILRQLHPLPQQRCPSCGAVIADETTQRNFWKGRRCACKACGRWFSATSGTYLQGTQMSFAQLLVLFNLCELLTGDITPGRIASSVGVSIDTVRIWKTRLKAAAHE